MTGLHPTDRDLAARFVAKRDETAFRQLFRRHTPRMYALALRLMAGRRADAEDVVQDAWQRAAAGLAGFEWRSALPTWLAGILINCARERLRAETAEAAAATPADADLTTPAGQAADAGLRLDLERAIAALPDGYREVLVLHDVEGYTHDEIAARLAIAPGTSKSQLFHARRAVRARLVTATSETTRHAG